MAGGGLIILRHKTWNPRRRDNMERIAADEAEHAKKQESIERRRKGERADKRLAALRGESAFSDHSDNEDDLLEHERPRGKETKEERLERARQSRQTRQRSHLLGSSSVRSKRGDQRHRWYATEAVSEHFMPDEAIDHACATDHHLVDPARNMPVSTHTADRDYATDEEAAIAAAMARIKKEKKSSSKAELSKDKKRRERRKKRRRHHHDERDHDRTVDDSDADRRSHRRERHRRRHSHDGEPAESEERDRKRRRHRR
ncbi:MAG: hypothetical protein MHM6MM_003394 [Cercozoa sp. M6MM]